MYDAIRAKARADVLLSMGLCPRCGGKRPLREGKKSCWECAVANSRRGELYREKKRMLGLCQHCGKPLVDTSQALCEPCRIRNKACQARLRDRRAQNG